MIQRTHHSFIQKEQESVIHSLIILSRKTCLVNQMLTMNDADGTHNTQMKISKKDPIHKRISMTS
jgi:hypothetical protein